MIGLISGANETVVIIVREDLRFIVKLCHLEERAIKVIRLGSRSIHALTLL